MPADAETEGEAGTETEALADGVGPVPLAGRSVPAETVCLGGVLPAIAALPVPGVLPAFAVGGIAECGVAKGDVAGGEDVADGVSTASLSTGMPGSTPAFLITTFAPSRATQTAMTVPAIQAARPTKSLTI